MNTTLIPTLIVGACLFLMTGCSTAESTEAPAIPARNSASEQAQQPEVSNSGSLSTETEAKLKEAAQSAPENSEYASLDGIELRTFKSHPKLSKVEKLNNRPDGSMVKVYYTDGAVVQLPGRMIESLSTISSAEILRIAQPGPRREKSKRAVKRN